MRQVKLSADYIGECLACAQHELRVDDCIAWRTEPHGDGDYSSSRASVLLGASELKFLIATYSAHCRNCDCRHFEDRVLATRQDIKPKLIALDRCSHCHTVWGQGAEKQKFGNVDSCSRCHYTQ